MRGMNKVLSCEDRVLVGAVVSRLPKLGLVIFFIAKLNQPSSGPTPPPFDRRLPGWHGPLFGNRSVSAAPITHQRAGRTECEQAATILLPNSVAQRRMARHDRGAGSEKSPIIRDILIQNKTGRHGH